jgi:hypothetical protein
VCAHFVGTVERPPALVGTASGSDPPSDQVGGLAPEKGTSARLADGFDAKDLLADAVRGDHDRLDCHQRTGVAGGAVAGLAGLSGHHDWTLIGLASTPVNRPGSCGGLYETRGGSELAMPFSIESTTAALGLAAPTPSPGPGLERGARALVTATTRPDITGWRLNRVGRRRGTVQPPAFTCVGPEEKVGASGGG